MSRSWVVPAVALLSLPLAAARADEEEPELLGKKLSAWVRTLQTDKDVKQRRRALIAVETIGAVKSRKVIDALVKALREDADEGVRTSAALATGRAVSKLMAQARADKLESLPRVDEPRDALTRTLRTDRSAKVREASATALGNMGPDARGAVGTLALALREKEVAIVRAAAAALRKVGKEARDAQEDLQNLLKDAKADKAARTEAALALGYIDADARDALPVLRDVLADAKAPAEMRRAAAQSLGRLGKEAADASPALGKVLVDRGAPTELRLAAVTALDQFGAEARAAIPELTKAVGDPDRFVRCLAMQALGRMGKDLEKHRKTAVKAIVEAVDADNLEVRVAAVESLGALGPDGLGEEAADVVRKLDTIIAREGRKPLVEAAQAAREKLRPKAEKPRKP